MATRIEPLHPWWILLAALLLWLLATSVASASGWGEEEGVRYRTYRSGAATPTAAAVAASAPAVEAIRPWVRLDAGVGADVWVEPWLFWPPGFTPFAPPAPFSGIATPPPAPADGSP